MTWPALPDSCIISEVGGSTVVFDRRSGVLSALNPTAAFVVRERHRFEDLERAAEGTR